MINLEFEARKQKMKISNIFWQHFKYTFAVVTLNILSISLSTANPSSFLKIVLYVTLISFAFNLAVFVYLVCMKKEFPRVEFFLIYTVNLFVFLVILISALKEFVSLNHQEPLLFLFIKGLVFLLLQKELEILIIMILPFEIGNRQVNICTSNVCVFLLLSLDESQKDCSEDSKMTILGLMLLNILTLVFFSIFNLMVYKYPSMRGQIRNFINLTSILIFFVNVTSYISVIFSSDIQQCDGLNYIFQAYIFVVPINIVSVCFIVYQECISIHSESEREKLINENEHLRTKYSNQHFMMAGPQKSINQINQQLSKKQSSLKSQQSQSINQQSGHQFQQSQSISLPTSNPPNFPTNSIIDESQRGGVKSPRMLEKLGTSQFGDSMYPKAMLHSWANVHNTNPFVGQNESFINQISNGESLSKTNKNNNKPSPDESIVKREGDESFQIPNPMDSGSQLTVK